MKASVLNAERADIFLQLDAAALFKRSTFVQHHEVVAQGETDFGYGGGFEQRDNRKGESGEIEAEKETMLFDEICNKATLCDCPLVNDGRVSLSIPSMEHFFR